MLRVYLDQNKWVDLAHAATRDSEGQAFQRAYAEATKAAAQGRASSPLSSVHMDETFRIHRFKRRHDVAFVMVGLSGRDSIAGWREVTEAEMDRALHELCGRPAEPPQAAPFGIGMAFACGGGSEDTDRPHDAEAATAEFLALAEGDSTTRFQQHTAERFQDAVALARRWSRCGRS